MSSLVFYTDEDQALVATDTLVVDPDGSLFMFSSKALYLPHLKTIVAGTGVGNFSVNWAAAINNHLVVRGIEHLDFHTPDALKDRWAKIQKEYPEIAGTTTTVYHFGISEEDQQVVSFAYRSTNDFESERLSHGFMCKPECVVPSGESILQMIPEIMNAQRKQQASVKSSERLYIGGEAIVMHLNRDACTTSSLYKFSDFEDDLERIFENFETRID